MATPSAPDPRDLLGRDDPISILTGLRNSVPYLVGLSVYALAGAHLAAWQGSRAETKDGE